MVRNADKRSRPRPEEPTPERVKLRWLQAVDLGFAEHAPDKLPPFRIVAVDAEATVRQDGITIPYKGFKWAMNIAPRHVKKRILREGVLSA